MVDLQKIVPNLKMDIRYATKNNVTKEVLYNTPRAFLRLPAALALQKVAKELELNGLGIVVYDGYRPYAITKKIWEFVLDDNYAASPKTGSRHNRGCAIDLGLYDLKTGEYLEMPTEFDSFNEEAWHKFSDLSLIVRVNRALLRSLMTKYGFDVLESEWWHYDFSTWKNFELMDIPFEEL
jgi:D-alanyl-D-alanine dipeptidase